MTDLSWSRCRTAKVVSTFADNASARSRLPRVKSILTHDIPWFVECHCLVSVLDLEQYRLPGRTGDPATLGRTSDTDVVSL